LDYKTGELKWKVPTNGGPQGLLSTAGGQLFGTDGAGNSIAFDAQDGKTPWDAGIGTPGNAPETYMLDGRQYVAVGAGYSLYAFYLQ
jgi:alcohol dehydrogenase (cytochrome c)